MSSSHSLHQRGINYSTVLLREFQRGFRHPSSFLCARVRHEFHQIVDAFVGAELNGLTTEPAVSVHDRQRIVHHLQPRHLRWRAKSLIVSEPRTPNQTVPVDDCYAGTGDRIVFHDRESMLTVFLDER